RPPTDGGNVRPGVRRSRHRGELLTAAVAAIDVVVKGGEVAGVVGSKGKPQIHEMRTGISDRLRLRVLAVLDEGDRLRMAAFD
ncbi:hypothetical protein ACV334_36360, partial [Pseudomonas aeruginosa]